METFPKVTIVIPVYNVEKYLPECLDSVLAQTMRDIQIICVNDGSPDRSPEILEEYAARDSRIEVVHKPNGGLSSARNAAYPLIRGKYTLFLDSDDYIDPTLCEKTWTVAEREQADMTFFLYHTTRISGQQPPLEKALRCGNTRQVDTPTLLKEVMAWCKLWKTSFLFENDVRFPEGLCFEDNVAHWKAMQCRPVFGFVPEKLHYYRTTASSIISDTSSPRYMDVVACYEIIRQDMIAMGNYHDEWKRLFLETKLRALCSKYNAASSEVKAKMWERIVDSYGDDEKEFMRSDHGFPWYAVDFYRAVEGSKIARCKCVVNSMLANIKHAVQYRIALLREKFRKAD